MSSAMSSTRMLKPRPLPHSLTSAVWGELETLIDALAAGGRDPSAAVVRSAQKSLGADLAFFDPGSIGGPVEVASPSGIGPDWCHAFTRRVLADAHGNDREFLLTDPPAAPGDTEPPRSAAFVCLSRSRRAWLAVVSFRPDRALGPSDLKLLVYIRKVFTEHLRREKAADDLKAAVYGLIHGFASVVDGKDPYGAGHSDRVARIAARLGRQLKLPRQGVNDLYLVGLLHDIGKVASEDVALTRPGPMTDAEFASVQDHPAAGGRVVAEIALLKHLAPAVRGHHERVDGKGYPDGLSGESIPLAARIVAVADSVDAMTSGRPQRSAMTTDRLEGALRAGAGAAWDVAVVDAFFACRHDVYAICARGAGERGREFSAFSDPALRKALPGYSGEYVAAAPPQKSSCK
jgi:hypothetical protein